MDERAASAPVIARRRGVLDPALAAVVRTSVPLHYRAGADPALDRPAHARAASGIAAVPAGYAIVQDDANFIAVVDAAGRTVESIALPAHVSGVRLFDSGRGNKRFKLDLETCVSLDVDGEAALLAFGSGSTERREHLVLVRQWDAEAPVIDVIPAHALYRMLRDERDFSGGALNLEGAVVVGSALRLFNRGNGAAAGDIQPVAATCDLALASLLGYLRTPADTDPPAMTRITRYALGEMHGIALGFTDATQWQGRVVFSAAAENSADTVADGDVAGAVIGIIDDDGNARWTPLVMSDCSPCSEKVEGITPLGADTTSPMTLLGVTDRDDWRVPSTLCTIELSGTWLRDPSLRPM